MRVEVKVSCSVCIMEGSTQASAGRKSALMPLAESAEGSKALT